MPQRPHLKRFVHFPKSIAPPNGVNAVKEIRNHHPSSGAIDEKHEKKQFEVEYGCNVSNQISETEVLSSEKNDVPKSVDSHHKHDQSDSHRRQYRVALSAEHSIKQESKHKIINATYRIPTAKRQRTGRKLYRREIGLDVPARTDAFEDRFGHAYADGNQNRIQKIHNTVDLACHETRFTTVMSYTLQNHLGIAD